MASSASHINNNGVPLATLLEWYKIRDTFFGANHVFQNIPLAIEMASSCQHPDARWLLEVCEGKDVKTSQDAKLVFSALGQNDAHALCFTWLCCDEEEQENLTSLRRSAELGFALAQAWMADWIEGEEKFKFALLAATQGERDGFYWLGVCFLDREGCEKDLDKARENFLLASEVGDVAAMDLLGDLLEDLDPQKWIWWGRAAALGNNSIFLSNFAKQVLMFSKGSGSAAVMFAIGRALQGQVNQEARTIFGIYFDFDSRVGPAKQAIAFYEAQIKATKDAMHAWTQVGLRYNVVKDVRKLIAKLIWDWREQALFKNISVIALLASAGMLNWRGPVEVSSSQMKNRFFSQEMASSASHINNNGVPLATLLEWYKIRDTFLGRNCVSQNIALALQLAGRCDHPDARWLTDVCAGKDVETKEEGKRVFSALDQDDARALCFAWLLGDREDLSPLRRSAELGFAFAQGLMADETLGKERLKFAQLGAAQGERDSLPILGWCFRDGAACEVDLHRAKESFCVRANSATYRP